VGVLHKVISQIGDWATGVNDNISNLQKAVNSQVEKIEAVIRKVDDAQVRTGRDLANITAVLARTNIAPGLQLH